MAFMGAVMVVLAWLHWIAILRDTNSVTVRTIDEPAMPIDPDDLPKKKRDIVLGEDLYTWSAHELAERIAELEQEISRCRDAIGARSSTKAAADAFFKK
ncbi:MAG: DUF1192 family protein [Alphaproteobacteria bacterium]|nr:DUF1192 family protein [Alphaproteobacteria bacterium]